MQQGGVVFRSARGGLAVVVGGARSVQRTSDPASGGLQRPDGEFYLLLGATAGLPDVRLFSPKLFERDFLAEVGLQQPLSSLVEFDHDAFGGPSACSSVRKSMIDFAIDPFPDCSRGLGWHQICRVQLFDRSLGLRDRYVGLDA